jgi:dihydroflavonol-4-reductase
MATAFVTGATGFIGCHVALLLLEKGWNVRAIRRQPAVLPLPRFMDDVDWHIGDIRDVDSVTRAMHGSNVVFHVAADYRLWARDPAEVYETNVSGTRNVLEAAIMAGKVERVVHTSSVGALGLKQDGSPADENTPVCLQDMVGHYKRSKFLAERTADEYVRRGLDLVIVNPSTPVGPCDHKPTPTGKIIVDFLNGRMPAFLNTGLNLVHVADVASGHILALEKGRTGEKYILGNQNLTLAEIFQRLQSISGVAAPRFCLPYRPILALAHVCEAISRITGKEPMIPFEGVKMAKRLMFFDATKAVFQLGLPQTPVETALEDAVRWFQQNGYITN